MPLLCFIAGVGHLAPAVRTEVELKDLVTALNTAVVPSASAQGLSDYYDVYADVGQDRSLCLLTQSQSLPWRCAQWPKWASSMGM